MNETLLVWVLVVVSRGNVHMPITLGPYADLASCQRVQAAERVKPLDGQCVQVVVPRPKVAK